MLVVLAGLLADDLGLGHRVVTDAGKLRDLFASLHRVRRHLRTLLPPPLPHSLLPLRRENPLELERQLAACERGKVATAELVLDHPHTIR